MDTDGEQTPRSPFWIQSTTNVRRVDLYRRRASSLIFNSGVLIILLLLFAILSIFFIIPSLISFTSHFLKPNLVKKSWDSINLVLVLFALAFGFLSRNINTNNNTNNSRFENGFNRSRSDLSSGAPVSSPMVSTPNHWYDFPEQPISGLRRHRSTSSYPDLRELSPPWNHRGESPWRFSDDTHLNNHNHRGVVNYDRYYFRREYDMGVKDFDGVVDLVKEDSIAPPSQPPVVENESYSHSPPLPQPPSPPQQPSDVIRTYHSVGVDDGDKGESMEFDKVLLPEKENESPENQDSDVKAEIEIRKKGKRERRERRRARSSEPRKMVSESNDLVPEPLSPPPISPEFQDSDRKTGKERKRTGANATKEFFTSLYQKKKKKRQRQRSVDNLDILLHHPQPPVKFQLPPPSPPPPPPPPPPPSILNNLFTSKKDRRKKTSSSTPPAPPPPPPSKMAARAPKPAAARVPKPTTITRVAPFVTEKPRAPVKMKYFNSIDDNSSGGESPMRGIPPPPPMPPFKMPDWKFAVEGDYVRVQSTLSSGSLSPDGDEAQSPSSAVASPVFCPSPDVNTKADKFIERFRAGLKLEKINSFNQNQGNRMSNLGPGPGPSRSYRL
ncbi:hypothetical protein HanXRQr2_Chr10g0459161 [Helianthus annuus]|uniref:Hydroxyproline-rich glycoprotein family protein n=1 Tax=Helianthus annuus TaxID=4232 RepID=A0A9K3HZU1_HELAN|nr:pollen-specific leucine-rich repeat extensin-like protein 1 [Helianthus annuus]KAF5787998.1 hypothetical protein HanXRQr2_Chr10g0459161 [Helianthus annuus]